MLRHMIFWYYFKHKRVFAQAIMDFFFLQTYFRIGHDPSSEIHIKYLKFLNSFGKWSSAPHPKHMMILPGNWGHGVLFYFLTPGQHFT